MTATSTDVVNAIVGFVGTVADIIFLIVPAVLGAVGLLLALGLGVRYAYKWIKRTAN